MYLLPRYHYCTVITLPVIIRVLRVQVPGGGRVHARSQHACRDQRLPVLPFTLPCLVMSDPALHCIALHRLAFAFCTTSPWPCWGVMAHPGVQVCGNNRSGGDVSGNRAGAFQFIGCGYGQLQPVKRGHVQYVEGTVTVTAFSLLSQL